jgi:hypothetical protein
MIGDGQVDFQHSHDRANQPFALAERQSNAARNVSAVSMARSE